jgi:HTH-type transcriptional regulator, transcriptional repressor of NAD biosynthesis genes
MSCALVVGEFCPPVAADVALLGEAARLADVVVALVVMGDRAPVPAAERVAWLARAAPGTAVVTLEDASDPARVEAAIGAQPIVVAGAPHLATVWGAKELDDSSAHGARERARRDPVAAWGELPPPVRAGLTRRVCFVGAESSGKTTLSRLMADRHRTAWVPEYGRDYTVDKIAGGTNDQWDTDDFVAIARRQGDLEDATADHAGPLLFCDTDAFATAIWHERYLRFRTRLVEDVAEARRYDLYVLCGIEVPFEADGVRFSEHIRPWMQQRFRDGLHSRPHGEPWIELTGAVEQRVAALDAAIVREGLLQPASMLSAARWSPVGRPAR